MKKIAILILFIFLPVTVIADSPAPPSSYIVTSSNGKYIFAMIAPVSKEEELFYWNEETQIRLAKIRDKYQQSGMYLANDASKPIWSVNWYAFGVEIANDGEHIIRPGPWASKIEDEALSFFRNGNLVKSYQIKDLVKKKRKLKYTVSHFFWVKEKLFDSEALKYYLATYDDRQYIFNVENGEIVEQFE